MRVERHRLTSATAGTCRELLSLHFGTRGGGQKVYLQAGLHADEIPAMLVLHHLRGRLEAAEARGELAGEVVLVPMANPIGINQWLLYGSQGRFELGSAENFNRRYPDLLEVVVQRTEGALGPDPERNRQAVREALQAALADITPVTELEHLRLTLMGLAVDADVVLDLHCDFEAALHLYTEEPYWAEAEPLARHLGAQACLLARGSGGNSFDEACSQVWWQLAERLEGRFPIPLACLACTVEFRGKTDVGHELARRDADALYAFLQTRGVGAGPAPAPPPLPRPPTPLAGAETLVAPCSGVVVYLRAPGEWVEAGEPVAELVDPFDATVTPLRATVSGVLYARENHRFAWRGMALARVAGAVPFRSGYLLSP